MSHYTNRHETKDTRVTRHTSHVSIYKQSQVMGHDTRATHDTKVTIQELPRTLVHTTRRNFGLSSRHSRVA